MYEDHEDQAAPGVARSTVSIVVGSVDVKERDLVVVNQTTQIDKLETIRYWEGFPGGVSN